MTNNLTIAVITSYLLVSTIWRPNVHHQPSPIISTSATPAQTHTEDISNLAVGTLIALPNRNVRPIEAIAVGDSILAYDSQSKTLHAAAVLEIEQQSSSNLRTLTFDNEKSIVVTPEHLFWTMNKSWASLAHTMRFYNKKNDPYQQLISGDEVLFYTTENNLSKAQLILVGTSNDELVTFNISKLSFGDTFFANGFAVGVEAKDEEDEDK